MDKFKNKYRIPSARAQWWDYSNTGAYFITICTGKRQHFFGEIVSGKLQITDSGKIAEKLWFEIPGQFNFVELGAFVLMPNHIHGILVVETRFIASRDEKPFIASVDEKPFIASVDETPFIPSGDVETRLIASLPPPPPPPQKPGGITGPKNPMLNENISRVIRWYKGRCTFEIRKIYAGFSWQTRFHDHIIRNDEEYLRFSHYIETNPDNWENDKLFKDEK